MAKPPILRDKYGAPLRSGIIQRPEPDFVPKTKADLIAEAKTAREALESERQERQAKMALRAENAKLPFAERNHLQGPGNSR